MKNNLFNKRYVQRLNNNEIKVHSIYTILGLKFKFSIQKYSKLFVNRYLKDIKPYKVVPHKIWNVENKDEVLKLDWNEATISPTPLVKEYLEKLIQKPDFFNLYPATSNDELLLLLSSYCNLETKYIQYFASSDSIHEYLAKIYIREGDKVLIQSPSYDNFRLTVEANGAEVYFSNIDKEYKFNIEKFEEDIKTVNPSFVYMVNPNNPLGYVVSVLDVERLIKNNPDKMFLIDEAYFEFSKITCAFLVKKYKNILITRTMSKAFAIANFRFGYLIASSDNIKNVTKIRNPKNISTFTQTVAKAVLNDIPYMENYVKEVNSVKDWFISELRKLNQFEVFESKSNFVLIKCKTFRYKFQLFEYLIKNNIYVRNLMQSSLLYNCLRITIGNKSKMQFVLDKIKEFANQEKIENKSSKVAFFDFCGTIVDFQSGNPYVEYVVLSKSSFVLNFKNKIRKLNFKIKRKFNKNYPDKFGYLKLLKGFKKDELEKLAFEYYVNVVRQRFYQNIIKKIKDLKERGFRIYVVSAGYEIYLKYFVEEFDLDGVIATKIKFDKNEICKGVIDGKDCIKSQKVNEIKEFFKEENLSTYDTIAYSDSIHDLDMLNLCAEKYVVTTKEQNWMKENNCKMCLIGEEQC